jgi:flagellar motor switch protein FliM
MLNDRTLAQKEIDALFAAARAHGSERPPGGASPGGRTRDNSRDAARVLPYNFSSAGQISNEQLRAISMLNDLFARNLTHNLAAWLRTRFQVNLVSAEQIAFNDFLLRIPEICYVASVRLEPLGAVSVLQLDLGLAPPIVDLLLGGEGREGPLRELTDIEESIMASVAEIICRELTVAWQPVGLSFIFERRQMQTQVARTMAVTEKTLCLSFEIRMPHSSGLLNLAFPAVVANTILRRLTADWGRRRRHGNEVRARMMAAALRIRFGGSLQLPAVRVAATELENLEPGSLLRLNLAANTMPVLRVGGQDLHRGRAIRQGPHRAARLEEEVAERMGEQVAEQVAGDPALGMPAGEQSSGRQSRPQPGPDAGLQPGPEVSR